MKQIGKVPECTPSDSRDARTRATTHDDGKFVRTALVVTDGESGSVDVVLPSGKRLCQINIFADADGNHLMVDVIDVDARYEARRALTFSPKGGRDSIAVPSDGNLVGVDFANRVAS